jgi:hypothetical protein
MEASTYDHAQNSIRQLLKEVFLKQSKPGVCAQKEGNR